MNSVTKKEAVDVPIVDLHSTIGTVPKGKEGAVEQKIEINGNSDGIQY
jgi:hypothetical protein